MTKGRNKFSDSEFAKIRSLLGEKQRASRERQKVIRQQIRNLGFYISDFGRPARGFGPKDLDRLVETSRIQVTGRPSRMTNTRRTDTLTLAPSIWERFRAWLMGIVSRQRRSRGNQTSHNPRHKNRPRSGRLEPLLAPNLDVVFVGTEPGPTSARQGRYYANPRNTFYSDLHAAGFTPTQLRPEQYGELLSFGIGLDDVYDAPNALQTRLLEARPRAVCFNSKGALDRFVNGDLENWRGSDAGRYVSLGSAIVWAVPDSSPLASSYHGKRVRLLKQLRELLH